MTINKIIKIKNYRIFQDFIWSKSQPDEFKEKNIFYGWNGTGKSTLSNLFRAIEKKNNITEKVGDIEFDISGSTVDGANLSTTDLPDVRVFNKDFVAENVFTKDGDVAPIFFIGEKNIKNEKLVASLRQERLDIQTELKNKNAEKIKADKALNKFLSDNAKAIKNVLSSSGGENPYNNYRSNLYRDKCDYLLSLSDSDKASKILDESTLNKHKSKLGLLPRERLPPLKLSYPSTKELTEQVTVLLNTSVISKAIASLTNDSNLSTWMKMGLDIHREKQATDCLFCERPLPTGRIRTLEDHFNNEYKKHIKNINHQLTIISTLIDEIDSYIPAIDLDLYPDLKKDYKVQHAEFANEINRIKVHLEDLSKALNEKAINPFQIIGRSFEIIIVDANIISKLNSVIERHNEVTIDFQATLDESRSLIEESLVAQGLDEYEEKKDYLDGADAAADAVLESAKDSIPELEKRIKGIENEGVVHGRPATELNDEIQSYLGRDELKFEIQGLGYRILRNGNPAVDLSESERTSIAFLYFLKTLSAVTFKLEDSIVVIDDPVSSLDSASLFSAFGFMKEKTKKANQLFILTHSHSFFRQVKSWFIRLPKQKSSKIERRPGKFYMLSSSIDNRIRSSVITNLDSLLYDYESEYHYLFSLVYDAVNSDEKNSLRQNYYLPNITRRLLESFLAFRCPSKSGNLHGQLDGVKFDASKKVKMLGFLNNFSHADQITDLDSDHNPSYLVMTKRVLTDVLELIKVNDEHHYREMVSLCPTKSVAETKVKKTT
ncbi:MAG: AAA family ATPase [Gammaproteobacteria bacterium]|nr:AAA family ATPase [Gammaproteobacteria bacterium]